MHSRPRGRIGAVMLVCLLMFSAALLSMAAHSQGITATAKPPSVSTSADAAAIKLRLDDLERRVIELEKPSADEAEAEKEEVAVDKTMEQRLAAIETAQRDEAASDKAAQRPESTNTLGPQKVRAPFVVVDDDGNPLVTVDTGRKRDGARLTVGSLTSSSVALFASSESAFLQLLDQSDQAMLGLEVTPKTRLIMMS